MRLGGSNPVLRRARDFVEVGPKPITYTNVAMKTIFLILVTVASAFVSLLYVTPSIGLFIGAIIVGFISVLIGTRSINLAPIFGVIYAICEGVVLGYISIIYSIYYQGIVPIALITTMLVLLVMMLLFSTGIIRVTQKFVSVAVVALISVIIMQLILTFTSALYTSGLGTFVIIISAILSAIFLLIDFQAIKYSVDEGSDSRVGWILSLGLLVTIIWIYVEILRLLAIFSRR